MFVNWLLQVDDCWRLLQLDVVVVDGVISTFYLCGGSKWNCFLFNMIQEWEFHVRNKRMWHENVETMKKEKKIIANKGKKRVSKKKREREKCWEEKGK